MLPARAVASVADASFKSGYSLPSVSRGSAETTVFNCCGSKPISHLCRRGSNPYESSPLQDTFLRIEQEARQQGTLARSSCAGGPGANVNNGSKSSTQMGARHRYLPVQNGHTNHGVAASNDSNIHNIGPMQTPCVQPLLSETEMHWLEDATRSIIIADIFLMSLVYPDNSQLS